MFKESDGSGSRSLSSAVGVEFEVERTESIVSCFVLVISGQLTGYCSITSKQTGEQRRNRAAFVSLFRYGVFRWKLGDTTTITVAFQDTKGAGLRRTRVAGRSSGHHALAAPSSPSTSPYDPSLSST
jgi:hypothetical protein